MTNEELLEEAKRRYPIGTKFKCKHNLGLLCEVTIDGRWDTVNIDNKPSVIFYPKEGFGKYAYLGWLSTKWAEIVELPKQENTSRFEVGKWYKWNNDYNHYFKVSENKLIVPNSTIETSEDIHDKKYRIGINIWSVTSNTKIVNILEIQPYLPDNHPDKIIKQESNMFKKGDYIVITKSEDSHDFKEDYCFKVRKESDSSWDFYIELDARNRQNAWNSKYFEWRYATPEEIAEYDRLGKPYDVTTLQKKEEPKYEYEVVHCKTQEEWDFVCNIVKKSAIRYFPAHNTIRFSGQGWNNKEYYQQQSDVKIYSFQEWCNKFGHKPDFLNKQEEYKVGDWVKLEEWASNEYFKVSRIEGNSLYLQYDGEEWEYNLNQGKWLVRNNTPQTTTTYEKQVDNNPPKVIIGNTAIDIIAPKTSNSVTLGQIQKEINVKINFKQPVKI